jgi:hypothetical protein
MKVLALVLSALLLLTTRVIAVEYQGKNIDGRKLVAKAYYYKTGAVYKVQVRFKQNRATIYFVNGEQVTIKLRHRVITDPSRIEGFGSPGLFNLGGIFSAGLGYDNLGNSRHLGLQSLEGFWRISLEQTDIMPTNAKTKSKSGQVL